MIKWFDKISGKEVKIIPKNELFDHAYYLGRCRNADVAIWIEKKNCFIHIREKFGNFFTEEINHPEDDDGYDVFVVKELLYDPDYSIREKLEKNKLERLQREDGKEE